MIPTARPMSRRSDRRPAGACDPARASDALPRARASERREPSARTHTHTHTRARKDIREDGWAPSPESFVELTPSNSPSRATWSLQGLHAGKDASPASRPEEVHFASHAPHLLARTRHVGGCADARVGDRDAKCAEHVRPELAAAAFCTSKFSAAMPAESAERRSPTALRPASEASPHQGEPENARHAARKRSAKFP